MARTANEPMAGPPNDSLISDAVQRNNPSTAAFSSCVPHGQRVFKQVDLFPAQRPNLVLSERRIEREGEFLRLTIVLNRQRLKVFSLPVGLYDF